MTQKTFEQAQDLANDIKHKKMMIGNLSEMIDRAENKKCTDYILRVEYKPGQCTIDYYLMPELLPALKQAQERMKNEVQELERQSEEL